MFSFFNTSPKKGLISGLTNLGKPRVSSYIYRDELHRKGMKKDEAKTPMLGKEEVEAGLIELDNKGERQSIKVKVLMTKEEAARLLAKCKNGGLLDFKDVACELVQIPTDRVNVSFHLSSNSDTTDPTLSEEIIGFGGDAQKYD